MNMPGRLDGLRFLRLAVLSEMVMILALVALVVASFLINDNQAEDIRRAQAQIARGQAQIAREGAKRRHQICLSDEREHLTAVKKLRRLYRYLVSLPPRAARSSFNREILRQLPDIEDEAHTDVAPLFCDQPGEKAERLYRQGKPGGKPPVGLPEPDPVVPERPPSLTP